MKLSEFSVKNSLTVNLISLLILIAGFYTLFIFKIRKEAFPEVSYDTVTISTVYPGASAEEIERLVTTPLEKELKGIDSIEEMRSTSIENISSIKIEISEDAKDKNKVVRDIYEAVDRVTDLPDEVEDPVITEITSGEIPVIKVAVSGSIDEFTLQRNAENLEDILEDIPGVASIARQGWRDKEIWVEVEPDKLREYHVSMQEIMDALRSRNMSIPGGKLRAEKEYSVRTTGEFYTPQEIADVLIRSNDLGNPLYVHDVASVRLSFEDETTINKSRGTRAILLTVVKRASGDAVKIVKEVKEKTGQYLKNTDDDIDIAYIDDMSYYINRRLGVLKNNGVVALMLVCLVLMLFLSRRVAVLTAIGIPIAISGTLAIMAVFDISINLVSMFGLIIVLGMLVDDGIIVSENCSRYLEKGFSAKEAAIRGSIEVAKPVTITIITTVAAFFPLMFLSGILGKFIYVIPLVVIVALSVSLFEALVILPSHFADFAGSLRHQDDSETKRPAWFKKIVKQYIRIVNAALTYRYRVALGVLILMVITALLAKSMPFILFGDEDIEQFYIRAQAPVSTNLYETEKLMHPLEKIVSELPDDILDTYTTQIGATGQSWMFDPYGKKGSHYAQITVYTTPFNKRKENIDEIIGMLREKTASVKGFERIYFEKEQPGPPVGEPIAVQIRGEDFSTLQEIAGKVEAFLKKIPGINDVISDYDTGRGELRVQVDKEKAKQAQLGISDVASTVRRAFRGGVATAIKPTKAEEDIDVLVRFPPRYRDTRSAFDKIYVPNRSGDLVPLTRIAEIKETTAPSSIRHLDGKRIVTVRSQVDKKIITPMAANQKLAKKFSSIPDEYFNYTISFGGEQEENERSARDFGRAFLLAFFLIFMILAASFNSLIQPFIIMLAIPFGIIGVVWAFFFHGYPTSFFMMMGSVALIGIVVNDSIVLVEFINNLRRAGTERRASIIKAGSLRLRPVLLTTITTSLGLAPTAYGIGGGDPFLKPMALTIVWGIICATAMTLIVIPCAYAIIDDITLKIAGHGTVRNSFHKK